MPGKSDVKMPCGRRFYCGRTNCPHAPECRTLCNMGRGEGSEEVAKVLPPQKTQPVDTAYLYDGSFPGFCCCVHESVYNRELPATIWQEGEAQPSLFGQKWIETDVGKAQRVEKSIPQKISPRALELVRNAYLSCLAQKELAILRFLLLGYPNGGKTPWMFGHEDVKPLLDAEKHKMGEEHLLKGFVRFSDYGGVLAATISPKNFVLPGIAPHFVDRYPEENFLIYDKTHKAALIYENRDMRIVPMEGIEFPEADEKEEQYRALWKRFYNTIAIEARINPKCRRTHMPMRYWENMLEVQDLMKK